MSGFPWTEEVLVLLILISTASVIYEYLSYKKGSGVILNILPQPDNKHKEMIIAFILLFIFLLFMVLLGSSSSGIGSDLQFKDLLFYTMIWFPLAYSLIRRIIYKPKLTPKGLITPTGFYKWCRISTVQWDEAGDDTLTFQIAPTFFNKKSRCLTFKLFPGQRGQVDNFLERITDHFPNSV